MNCLSNEQLINVFVKARGLENIDKEFMKLLEEELMKRNLSLLKI